MWAIFFVQSDYVSSFSLVLLPDSFPCLFAMVSLLLSGGKLKDTVRHSWHSIISCVGMLSSLVVAACVFCYRLTYPGYHSSRSVAHKIPLLVALNSFFPKFAYVPANLSCTTEKWESYCCHFEQIVLQLSSYDTCVILKTDFSTHQLKCLDVCVT